MRVLYVVVVLLIPIFAFSQSQRFDPAIICSSIHESIEEIILEQTNTQLDRKGCRLILKRASEAIVDARDALHKPDRSLARQNLKSTMEFLYSAYILKCRNTSQIKVEREKTKNIYFTI